MPQTGAPPQLSMVSFLEGDWDVVMHVKPDPAGDWVETTGTSTFRLILNKTILEQDYTGDMWGQAFLGKGYLGFNRFTDTWQHSWSDNIAAIISLYEGQFENGELVVVGKEKTPQDTFYVRVRWFNISEANFEWVLETSFDKESWSPSMKAVYARKEI